MSWRQGSYVDDGEPGGGIYEPEIDNPERFGRGWPLLKATRTALDKTYDALDAPPKLEDHHARRSVEGRADNQGGIDRDDH